MDERERIIARLKAIEEYTGEYRDWEVMDAKLGLWSSLKI